MKRILLVVPSNRGTIATCSVNIFKALKKRNDVKLKCVLIQKLPNGIVEFEECDAAMSYEKGDVKSVTINSKVKWLKQIKQDFQPDITISTLFGCSTINVLAGGTDKKIGVFHSPHQQVKTFLGWKIYILTLLIYTFLYPFLDRLYCVSKEVADSILDTFPTIKKSKVEIVYNIHDLEQIRSLGENEIDEIDLVGKNFFLYCGRLDRNKVPQRLLQAFIKSGLSQKGYHLVFMGNDTDNMWQRLEEDVGNAGLCEFVHYIGSKSNPYSYMKSAVATVSCSFSEGLPGVLIESMILGTPVVSTNSSEGVWEILSRDYDYNPMLNDCYIGNKGIITSNLYPKDKGKWSVDIKNLACALMEVTAMERNESFEFENNIREEKIITKYII